jgi:aminoglycoside 3-N-acetyltransferase
MKPFSENELINVIRDIGLKKSDIAFVHSDLNKFGVIKDKKGRLQLLLHPETLFNAFQNVLGENGTLVVPAYTNLWPKAKLFSLKDTPTNSGAFSEYVRQNKNSLRSYHPWLSIAAIGKKGFEIVRNIDKSSYDPQLPYGKLHQLNAKMVMVGVPYCSLKDYVEVERGVPYRYSKYFIWKIENDDGEVFEDIFEHTVRYPNQDINMIPFYDGLTTMEKRKVKFSSLGKAFVRCVEAKDAYDIYRNKLDKDPFVCVNGNPPNKKFISMIHYMTNESSETVRLSFFAINKEEGEKWIWSISNAIYLDKKKLASSGFLSCGQTKHWWTKLIPKKTDYVISSGDKNISGAEIAIKIMKAFAGIGYAKEPRVLNKEFVSCLLEYPHLIYSYN